MFTLNSCRFFCCCVCKFNWLFNTLAHPGSKTVHEFYNAWLGVVDYGACCLVTPHLNFVNNKTNKIKMSEYATKDWLDVPKGAQNGLMGGMKFLLDIELFDFTYTGKEFAGFKIGFIDPRDKAMMKQDGYFISSGE